MAGTPWYSYPITHGYYATYDPNIADTPHFAVDIGTPFHTPITALKAGTVVTADYQPWGGEVFIKPDDGSTEYYYYHPDLVEVQAGQHVSAGQEVALSGGENPEYPGALHPALPIWSTGPHTHVGYWTSWTNTPVGSRPMGPDITPLITQLASGQGLPASTQISPPASNGTPATGPTLGPTPTVSPSAAVSTFETQVQSGISKTAIFIIAGLFIIGGFYIAFKDQINSTVKTAAKAAVLA
jgi:murein DD-endopeptidase MepM/ murein hydrolase activator NlpD